AIGHIETEPRIIIVAGEISRGVGTGAVKSKCAGASVVLSVVFVAPIGGHSISRCAIEWDGISGVIQANEAIVVGMALSWNWFANRRNCKCARGVKFGFDIKADRHADAEM